MDSGQADCKPSNGTGEVLGLSIAFTAVDRAASPNFELPRPPGTDGYTFKVVPQAINGLAAMLGVFSSAALRGTVRLRHVFLLMALVVDAQRACANDLLEFYRLALSRDAVLQAASYQRDAAIEARPQALSQLLPQVGATASAGREREGQQTTVVSTSQATNCVLAAGQQMENCYSNTHAYGLTLRQTLWSFESFSRLKEANFLAASAQANLLGAQQGLLLRVAMAYFGILSARDQLATNRRAREAFGTLLNQAKVRERTGISPRSDVAQAQSFYDATEQSVIDAQNAVDDAELVLTEIIGAHPADIAPLREDIPLTPPEPDSADAWVASARQDNPAVRAAELQAEAADRDIAVQRGKGLPSITLNGSSSRSWQDPAFGGKQTLDTVGVSFSWPLFESGAVASAVRQSRALYRHAQALYDSAQRGTERQTRAAYRGVVTGILRIGAARRAVESGRQAVEASKRNVEFGTGSVFDLLNAQNNYHAAQRAYSQTRYDYLTALLTLKQQAGRLAEQDLEVIDGLLVTH
jgi:outer membrane protein